MHGTFVAGTFYNINHNLSEEYNPDWLKPKIQALEGALAVVKKKEKRLRMETEWDDVLLAQKFKENPDLAKANASTRLSTSAPNRIASSLESERVKPKPHKYHIVDKSDRTYDGKVYRSKKEANRVLSTLRMFGGIAEAMAEQWG